jgi:hypothetical protein
MPYKIKDSGGGFKVTSPNHPQGFSKKPQSKEMAIKQMVAIKMHDKEHGGEKPAKKVGVRKGK